MSEIPGRHLSAPESERAPLAGRPKIATLGKHKQKYQFPLDFQAALFLLAPMIFLVAILAVAGARQ